MNAASLAAGNKVMLGDGSVVEVLSIADDQSAVHVKYVDSMDNPAIPVGTVADVPSEDVISMFEGEHAEGLT
jgi:hypothetical protein